MSAEPKPVVIFGAGINGAALARELLVNRVPVVVVEAADIASGATSASSRLIHGGLRYLEHGEFDLVRESLAERTRLLRLAPQFVQPLRLFIPLRTRFTGMAAAAGKFFGWPRNASRLPVSRGLWLVRMGLRLYDVYAKDPLLPRHRAYRTGGPDTIAVDRRKYRWQCSYYDAQIMYPERFVLALLEDARRLAAEQGTMLEILTRHRARLRGTTLEVLPSTGSSPVARSLEPAAIVNATGAWVDWTLEELTIRSKRLMGGTKGSHFLTASDRLKQRLAGHAVYAEASDGRPFFILPLGEQVLVGTTDIPFDGPPSEAIATPAEVEYLVDSVNEVFPDLGLSAADIDWHYSGVRPLPFVDADTPAAITRRHWLEENREAALPCYSVIGGKLTTCRSLAEEAAETILKRLDRQPIANSRERLLPGAEQYPATREALVVQHRRWAEQFQLTLEQIQAIWPLYGTRIASILLDIGPGPLENIDATAIPLALAQWSVRHEWATSIDDLVERRLMLLYGRRLTRKALEQLAEVLSRAGLLEETQMNQAVESSIERLQVRYGKRVESSILTS